MALDPATCGVLGALGALAVCWLILGKSPFNAWGKLSARFGTDRKPEACDFRFATIVLGFVSYRSIVRVSVFEDGLFLGLPALFRIGMPNLLIPWQELTLCPGQPKAVNMVKPLQIMLSPGAKFTIGHPVMTTLWLPKKVFERVSHQLTTKIT